MLLAVMLVRTDDSSWPSWAVVICSRIRFSLATMPPLKGSAPYVSRMVHIWASWRALVETLLSCHTPIQILIESVILSWRMAWIVIAGWLQSVPYRRIVLVSCDSTATSRGTLFCDVGLARQSGYCVMTGV